MGKTTKILLAITLVIGAALVFEMERSELQSLLFSQYASRLTWSLGEGPSQAIRFPQSGPYDERLGYVALPAFIERAGGRHFSIERQARFSPPLLAFVHGGGYPIYPEKSQAGLSILDSRRQQIFDARYPRQLYPDFAAIPPRVVDTLLFIENREMLSTRYPHRNPAVDWVRLGNAVLGQVRKLVAPNANVAGGSTLATQIEKYRHSPQGRTQGIADKLRQMWAASLRAYSNGRNTGEARRRIVLNYLNSTPLGGRPGVGEINGLGDGLLAWYGTHFNSANGLLKLGPKGAIDDNTLAQQARVYRQVLSLLLAQRRPSYYLKQGRAELKSLTDSYLRLLAANGVIDRPLRDAALTTLLDFTEAAPMAEPPASVRQKGIDSVRYELLNLLQVPGIYMLDRLDLRVRTALDTQVQSAVNQVLGQLHDPHFARAQGLTGKYLLAEGSDPRAVRYSVTLYESTPAGNLVRVQGDNWDQPFDMNQGAMLDLGSTAKLRTLITYLEIIETLYQRFSPLPPGELRDIARREEDPLSRWVLDYLATVTTNPSLDAVLDAAMERRYSASPAERFFTGGGVHYFANFDRDDNRRVLSVGHAFRQSVNLVFIRLMRDIVRHYVAEQENARAVLADPNHPGRLYYLRRFADMEGRTYLNEFMDIYVPLVGREAGEESLAGLLGSRTRAVPYRLAMAFRVARPQASPEELARFLWQYLGDKTPDAREVARLYRAYDPARFSLNDQAYLARVHPLELWLVVYLRDHPGATRAQVIEASGAVRQQAYDWLFKTGRHQARQKRIRRVLEHDAFERIHSQWQRLGYPFARLVPSYATAIGTSADRPAALAELVGIILNEGVRKPVVRIESLHFGVDTPYETLMYNRPLTGERLLSRELASRVRRALVETVEEGTARRLKGVFRDTGGDPLLVGGKTGTGDLRFERFNRGGQVTSSEVRSRSAALAFFIGDRYFGVITAHVEAPHAKEFQFTSALAVQLLKVLEPALQPLFAADKTKMAFNE